MRFSQEKLRLSSQQEQKLINELTQYKEKISGNTQETESFKQRLQRALKENTELTSELGQSQENLRLSANNLNKIGMQLKNYEEEN